MTENTTAGIIIPNALDQAERQALSPLWLLQAALGAVRGLVWGLCFAAIAIGLTLLAAFGGLDKLWGHE